ncbi:nucleotidyltransferase family protein [Candidatus Accumulibacter sp. ACC012]|uniref:nucleotidyltransferase family protein n=1 Tax=Candidatus Accumulibacter sp. ACC012 TaxID=2823332 RepID=UPI0025C2C41A|nr:nucleotidyltransferase family protein [Candidatus Accumulibacter sp. ACC012]
MAGAFGRPLTPPDLPANQREWETMLRASSGHLAALQLRWALREQRLFSACPADVAEYLDAIYTLNLDRNLQCEDQLADFIRLLNSIDVRPVLLKGAAALVGGLYPTSGERMISDLDILIPAHRLPDIIDKLAGAGYKPRATEGREIPSPVGFRGDHHYPPVVSADWPSRVELHISPVHLEFAALLPSEEVYREATAMKWRGGECFLPSPTHFVAHNIIHAFLFNTKSGLEPVSLRQLFEFALASRVYAERIDWKNIRNRFESHGHGKALRQYLALANTLLDFHVPEQIDISAGQRPNIQPYLIHLDLDNRSALWTINFLRQVKSRLRSLWQRRGKIIQELSTPGVYKRFVRSILGSPEG